MGDVEKQIQHYKERLDGYLERTGEDAKILHIFKKLRHLPVTLEHLQITGIGKSVYSYRKYDAAVGEKARDIVARWKTLVPPEEGIQPSLQSETISETAPSAEKRAPYIDNKSLDNGEEEVDSPYEPRMPDGKSPPTSDTYGYNPSQSDASHHKKRRSSYVPRMPDGQSPPATATYEYNPSQPDSSGHKKEKNPRSSYVPLMPDGQSPPASDKYGYKPSQADSSRHKKKDKISESSYVPRMPDGQSPPASGTHEYNPSQPDPNRHKKKDKNSHSNKSDISAGNGREHSSQKDKSSRSSSHSSDRRSEKIKVEKITDKSSNKPSDPTKKHSSSQHQSDRKEKDNKHASKTMSSSPVSSKEQKPRSSHSKSSSSSGSSRSTESGSRTSSSNSHKHSHKEKSLSSSSASDRHKSSSDKINHNKGGHDKSEKTKAQSQSKKRDIEGQNKDNSSFSSKPTEKADDVDNYISSKKSRVSHFTPEASHISDSGKAPSQEKKKSSSHSSPKKESKSKESGVVKSTDKPLDKRKSDKSIKNKESSHKKSVKPDVDALSNSEDDNAGMSFEDMLNFGNSSKPVRKVHPMPREKTSAKEVPQKKTHSSSKEKPTTSGSSKRKSAQEMVPPKPSKQVKLSQQDILSTLPEISPNYKPLPHLSFEERTMRDIHAVDQNLIGTKNHSRTQVYSGRKQIFLAEVPTLYNAAMLVLAENIDALEFVGGVPSDILMPVLEKCTVTQLYRIEDFNPQFVGELDDLWKTHSCRDFKMSQPEEMESYRELYLRKFDEREDKLKRLSTVISKTASQQFKSMKKTKVAFVDVAAKPPRGVKRQQLKHGTAGPMGAQDSLSRLTSHGGSAKMPRAPAPSSSHSDVSERFKKAPVRPVAPMMMKTKKLMKNLHNFRR